MPAKTEIYGAVEPEVYEWLQESAKENKRSLRAEVEYQLEQKMKIDKNLRELNNCGLEGFTLGK